MKMRRFLQILKEVFLRKNYRTQYNRKQFFRNFYLAECRQQSKTINHQNDLEALVLGLWSNLDSAFCLCPDFWLFLILKGKPHYSQPPSRALQRCGISESRQLWALPLVPLLGSRACCFSVETSLMGLNLWELGLWKQPDLNLSMISS